MNIIIGGTQWVCTLAWLPHELSQGLSGLASLPPYEGMLFDLGADFSRVDIDVGEMLFPLDIVFIGHNLNVVGVLHDVQPNDEAYFLASNTLGARYFIEVNAGEAASVNVGDAVVLQDGAAMLDITSLVMIVAVIGIMSIALKSI